jgi:LysR family transcriptional regulator, glycine cleavage system transcriptional activator
MPVNETRFPSIDALRAFDAAGRLGSFDKAAQELAITASALSKRISALEALLGAALFDRSSRAIALTAAGKEYAEQVRHALNALASIGLHARAEQSVRRVRLLSPPTFAREILMPRLKAFTDKFTDCEIEIVVAIPYLDRSTPEADVTVRFGPRDAGEPLLFERVFAVAPPGFAQKHRLRTPADLLRVHPEVPRVRCPIEPWRAWFAALGIADAPEPRSGIKVVDLGLMLEGAAYGHGVALARASLAARRLADGSLVRLFDASVASNEGYTLIVHHASAQALAFAHWLRAECAKLEKLSRKT